MRNFQRIAAGMDVLPLMHAVTRQPHLWNQHRFRTSFAGTPHVDVDDIWLRFSDLSKTAYPDEIGEVINDDRPVWHEAASALPEAKLLVLNLMRAVEAHEVGRLLITRIRPGGVILRHADTDGAYVQGHNIHRYHIVLQGFPGSVFRCGDESVCMQTGDCFWFNPSIEHEVHNGSADDRVHLIADLRLWR